MALPDLNQSDSTSGKSDDAITLGLINASNSSDLNQWNDLSAALVTLKGAPENTEARARVSEVHEHVMGEAQALLDDPSLGIDNDHANTTVGGSAEDGVDFNDVEETISELNVVEEQANAQYRAQSFSASSEQYGADPSRSYANPSGQWWWVSAPGVHDPQWVVLEFAEAFVLGKVEFGTSLQFYGHGSEIQGSNDGEQWDELLAIDTVGEDEFSVDERRVKHFDVALDITTAYKYYRYYSQPSKHIWLEYVCLTHSDDVTDTSADFTVACLSPQVPVASDSSSMALHAKRIGDPNNNKWWVSQMASGNAEWLAIEYEESFVATRAKIKLKEQNQGTNPVLQGSSDGVSWTQIATISTTAYSGEILDSKGFREFELTFDNAESFIYYRYYTEPTSVAWLAYLSFGN
jgi:hypothetical protein